MYQDEPLITVAGVTAVVSALLVLLVAFGLPISDGQTQAILGFVAVAAPIAVGIIARRHVTPAERVRPARSSTRRRRRRSRSKYNDRV